LQNFVGTLSFTPSFSLGFGTEIRSNRFNGLSTRVIMIATGLKGSKQTVKTVSENQTLSRTPS
jgi:hypothetical protein